MSAVVAENKKSSKDSIVDLYRNFGYDIVELRKHMKSLQVNSNKVLVAYDLHPDGTVTNYQ